MEEFSMRRNFVGNYEVFAAFVVLQFLEVWELERGGSRT